MVTSSWRKKADKTDNNVIDHPRVKRRRQRTFHLSRSKLPLLIVGLLLFYVTFSLGSRFDSLYSMQRDLQAVQAEVQELRKVNEELKMQLQLLQSDAYVEQVARDKLGLVKPGETRIVPVPPGAVESPQDAGEAVIGD